jgi:hypothetical protein
VRRRALLGRVCLVVLLVASGCDGVRRVRPARETSVEELLRDVEARRAAVVSLRARARLRSGVAGVWTRQAILVQRPSSVRIDVLSPFGLALAVGTEGRTLWAFPPQQAVRYEGAATRENLARLLGTPLEVADMVDVLLGVPPAREPFGAPSLERDGDEYVLTVPFRGGHQESRFAVDTLAVTRIEERRDAGGTLRVTFADYRDGFARTVDLLAEGGATASIAFDEVEPNVALDPAVFAPPPAGRVLPLERAGAPS